jgi:hypothetical protein
MASNRDIQIQGDLDVAAGVLDGLRSAPQIRPLRLEILATPTEAAVILLRGAHSVAPIAQVFRGASSAELHSEPSVLGRW